jgi:hypothetical protein
MDPISFLRSLSPFDHGFVSGWHGLTGCASGHYAAGADTRAYVRGFAFGEAMRSRYGN